MLSTKRSKLKKIRKWREKGGPDSVQQLAQMLVSQTDPQLLIETTQALAALPAQMSAPALMNATQCASAAARAEAVMALGGHQVIEALDALSAATKDADNAVRRLAAEALGNLGSDKAAPALVELLPDLEWGVHTTAAESLGNLGAPDTLQPMMQWVERVFTATSRKLSAADKAEVVRVPMTRLIGHLTDEDLSTMRDSMMMKIRIKSWEAQNGSQDWVTNSYENPIWTILQDELNRREARKPKPEPEAEAAPEVVEEEPPKNVTYPEITGVVADFLEMLKSAGLVNVALTGGAVRDLGLGRTPRDLDVTLISKRVAEPDTQNIVDWNASYIDLVADTLPGLAEALGVSIQGLIDGEARFASQGIEIPVQYVGPYVLEEEEVNVYDLQAEVKSRRLISRIALVADRNDGRIKGPVGDASVNRMWLDSEGRWGSASVQGIVDLEKRVLRVGGANVKDQPIDVFRVLYNKHNLGFVLSDQMILRLEDESQLLRHEPEKVWGYTQESVGLLFEKTSMQDFADEMYLLQLHNVLINDLPPETFEELNGIINQRAAGKTDASAAAKQNIRDARDQMDAAKEELDRKRADFSKYLRRVDVGKSTKVDIESRMNEKAEELRRMEEASLKSAKKLEAVTFNFQSIVDDENVDLDVIQKHREALAEKREIDEKIAELSKVVEQLRSATEKMRQSQIDDQNRMEKLGQELENAMSVYNDAKGMMERAEDELQKVEASMELTPERRREILRGEAVTA